MLKRIRCDGSCARGSLGYSVATVVDMACDVALPAARLLDEILADLASELRYYY